MRITTLHRLFRYKAWADDALLTALSQLGPDSPIPGLAIMLTVFGFNLFGDALRDALDPKLRDR